MKRIILNAGAVLLCACTSFAQGNFEIVSLGSTYSAEDINNAFAGANFCNRLYVNKRRTITLNDGSIVELFSTNELGQNASCGQSSTYIFRPEEWGIKNEKITIQYETSLQKKK